MHRYFGILCFFSMLAMGDFNDEELTPEQKNWKGDPNRMPGRVTKTDSSELIIAICVGVGTFLLLVAFIVVIIINKIKQKRAKEHLDRSMNFSSYSYEDVDTIQRSNEDIQLQSMNNNSDNQEDVAIRSTQQVNNSLLYGNEKSSEVSENEKESENKEVAENLTFENETSTFSHNYHHVPEEKTTKEQFQKELDEPLSQTDDILPPPPPLEELDEEEWDPAPLKEVTHDELPRPPDEITDDELLRPLDEVESDTVQEEDWVSPNETKEDDPHSPSNEDPSTELINVDDTEKFSFDVEKIDEEPEQVDEISMPDEQFSRNSTESEPNEMNLESEEPYESTYDNGFIKTTVGGYEDSTTNRNDSLASKTNDIGAKADEHDRSWIPPPLKDDEIIIITKDS